MTSGEAHAEVERADGWDAAADERQRLADEREQLASEREYLADERERLADEHERLLDQRQATLDDAAGPGSEAVDDEQMRIEAERQLARAEARLTRAVAERERAQVAIDRNQLTAERRVVDAERAARHELDDDGPWELERRDFVAVERGRLADLRDVGQDARSDLANQREREADHRDRASQERDKAFEVTDRQGRWGAGRASVQNQPRRSDVSQVRAAAGRQRQSAARTRQRASAGRAEARGTGAPSSFMPSEHGPRLAAEFLGLTRELFASQQLSDVADRVLGFAVDCLPPDVTAGLAISGGGIPALRLATDPVADQLDAFQIEAGVGPTIDALHSAQPVLAVTFTDWPDLAALGDDLGIGAAFAYGLALPRDGSWHALGVLTLYAEDGSSLDDETRDVCSIFASYLAVAAGLERDRNDLNRREAALHRALSSRDVIGQAKGILMERQRISAGDAFDVLRRTSQRLNRRLHEVAVRLAETGELPTA